MPVLGRLICRVACGPGGGYGAEGGTGGYGRTTAGLIFEAQSSTDFMVLDFPTVGQSFRMQQFWMTVSHFDKWGWRTGIALLRVPGVSSHPDLWHTVRVERTDTELRVKVDGCCSAEPVPLPPPRAGRLGFATNSGLGGSAKAAFNNLRLLSAVDQPGPAWNAGPPPSVPWRTVGTQAIGCGAMALLPARGGNKSAVLLNNPNPMISTDQGR